MDFIFYLFSILTFLIGVELLYKVALVFAIQHHESVTGMHIPLPPSITLL